MIAPSTTVSEHVDVHVTLDHFHPRDVIQYARHLQYAKHHPTDEELQTEWMFEADEEYGRGGYPHRTHHPAYEPNRFWDEMTHHATRMGLSRPGAIQAGHQPAHIKALYAVPNGVREQG